MEKPKKEAEENETGEHPNVSLISNKQCDAIRLEQFLGR